MIIIQGHLWSQLSLRLMGPVGEGYMSESDEDALQEEDGNGGWESTWQCQACFALKKFRFPRRHCGCGKQTFQAKGVAWAKPCFPNIVYKIEDILVIRTLYCVNKELEEQKVRGRIGILFPTHSFVEVGWAVEWDWSASALPLYCGSHSRVSQAEGLLLFFIIHSFFS